MWELQRLTTLCASTVCYRDSFTFYHEEVWGSEGISPPFLTSAPVGGEWSASRLGRFTPGERIPRYPLDRRPGGPQSRSGRLEVEKNILPHAENRTPPPCPAWSPSLYRLSSRNWLSYRLMNNDECRLLCCNSSAVKVCFHVWKLRIR
jgi:hypothetical protein